MKTDIWRGLASAIAVIAAGFLAFNGISGWGWFLVVAVLVILEP